jgi:hypothetical protein
MLPTAEPPNLADAGAIGKERAGAGGDSGTTKGDEPLLPQDLIDLVVLAVDRPFERARIAVAVRSSYALRCLEKEHPELLDWDPETLCTASKEGALEFLAFLRRRQESLGRPCPAEARNGDYDDYYPMDDASQFGQVAVLQWWKESGLELD